VIYTYYANGNRKDVTYPNGEKEVYTYDDAGNQLTKSENKGTITYTYDALLRLATVIEPSGK